MLNRLLNRLAGRVAPCVGERLAPIVLRELDRHIREVVLPGVTKAVADALVDRTGEIATALFEAELAKRPLLQPGAYLPLAVVSETASKVHFLQTADQVKYRPLLELTSQTVREYCSRHGFTCETFIGVVRGHHPWQASYNRIPLLRRLANSGFSGWVCYMDADAYVADLAFNLPAYLKDKQDVAMVLAPGEFRDIEWWNVNDGVFLLNLGHPKARLIVEGWNYLFGEVTEDELRSRDEWFPINHDQTLLWYTLQSIPDLRRHVLIDCSERIINYTDGRFIRQALRGVGTMEQRLTVLRSEVGRIVEIITDGGQAN